MVGVKRPMKTLPMHVQKVKKKAKIRNQYNQLPHLTRNIIWENDKNTRTHHTQESQAVITKIQHRAT